MAGSLDQFIVHQQVVGICKYIEKELIHLSDDDHKFTIGGDFNIFKNNLEAVSTELGFTIKQIIVIYNNNEEEMVDKVGNNKKKQ